MVCGPAEAEEVARDVLALRLRAFGMRHRERAEGLGYLAFHLGRQRRYADAAETYRRAIAVLRRLAPLDDRDRGLLGALRESLGTLHRWQHTGHLFRCTAVRADLREARSRSRASRFD